MAAKLFNVDFYIGFGFDAYSSATFKMQNTLWRRWNIKCIQIHSLIPAIYDSFIYLVCPLHPYRTQHTHRDTHTHIYIYIYIYWFYITGIIVFDVKRLHCSAIRIYSHYIFNNYFPALAGIAWTCTSQGETDFLLFILGSFSGVFECKWIDFGGYRLKRPIQKHKKHILPPPLINSGRRGIFFSSGVHLLCICLYSPIPNFGYTFQSEKTTHSTSCCCEMVSCWCIRQYRPWCMWHILKHNDTTGKYHVTHMADAVKS